MLCMKTLIGLILGIVLSAHIYAQTNTPDWAFNATIYEVNIRQFTQEGTFKAFEEHLPRLKELGVDIIWLMPIHPIGEQNRKGKLGSYYSVKDYTDVNPEFGTLDDFRDLVKKIHSLEMYIIIDWVANHTSWDNVWVEMHPEFFIKDENGNFVTPVDDWSDVIDLNFENKELWEKMADALIFWVKEFNIDGYRCDVAGMVPVEFWNYVRPQLDEIKPVFMLAEWDTPDMHFEAFDMTFDWELHKIMNRIYSKEYSVKEIINHIAQDRNKYPEYAIRMLFTDNHDENTWNGTVFERLGNAVEIFSVLSYTLPGMPLIYSGQEAGNNKRLEFFDKDSIDWKEHPLFGIYKKLNHLRKNNPALWSGIKGGSFDIVPNNLNSDVLTFLREKNNNKIFILLNLSDKRTEVELLSPIADGDYKEFFTQKHFEVFAGAKSIKLNPWEYRIYINI